MNIEVYMNVKVNSKNTNYLNEKKIYEIIVCMCVIIIMLIHIQILNDTDALLN